MEKHTELIWADPNDERGEGEQDQCGKNGADRGGCSCFAKRYALLFHEIDLDYTAACRKRRNIGYKDINENQFHDVDKRDPETHRPDYAIQPQSVCKEIENQNNCKYTEYTGG